MLPYHIIFFKLLMEYRPYSLLNLQHLILTAGILADSAMMVQGRSNRVCVAVLRDLTHYHEDVYTECVREGVNVLRSALIPQFEALVASSVQKIGEFMLELGWLQV